MFQSIQKIFYLKNIKLIKITHEKNFLAKSFLHMKHSTKTIRDREINSRNNQRSYHKIAENSFHENIA